jgi:hypothetical protein
VTAETTVGAALGRGSVDGMCANCLSTAETAIASAAFIGWAAKAPLHRALARLGVLNAPDPVAHDVTTMAFLRSLDLDPAEVLGADAVAAAEAWTPPLPRGLRPRTASRSGSLALARLAGARYAHT